MRFLVRLAVCSGFGLPPAALAAAEPEFTTYSGRAVGSRGEFLYAEHPVLVHYEGLSGLRDQRGENFRASIAFTAADRRETDAAAFTSAMQAAIAPCRA